MILGRWQLAYSWRAFAQAQWHWLPRYERVRQPSGHAVYWLCGLWYAFPMEEE